MAELAIVVPCSFSGVRSNPGCPKVKIRARALCLTLAFCQRAQTSAPLQASNTAPCYQAQGHCTALACALLHLLPRTHTCQLQLQLQHMLIQLLP